jgi:hypothetical protein
MKKIVLSFSLLLLVTFTFGQTVNLGIKAGANLSTVATTVPLNGFIIDSQNKTGYQAGLIVDVGFKNFSIEPGLFFITKGEKFKEQYTDQAALYSVTASGSTKLNYFAIPVNVLYKLQAAPAVKFYTGGGPYLGFGLSGKGTAIVTSTQSGGGSSTTTINATHDIKFGNDETTDEYKNPDYGINFVAGVELNKRITIDLNYSLGLANLAWGQGYAARNRTLGLSVGYLFR